MPRYEYECYVCQGKVFEKTRPMAESAEPAKCPRCNTPCERIISRIAPNWDKMERLGDARLLDD